jgi:hypothetical protein
MPTDYVAPCGLVWPTLNSDGGVRVCADPRGVSGGRTSCRLVVPTAPPIDHANRLVVTNAVLTGRG